VIAEGTGVVSEISHRFNKLSPKLQGMAKPFLLRPTNPASFWNHAPVARSSA
jgi:hypothetical protein